MLRPFAGLVARAPFPLLPARRHGSDRHKVLTAEDAVHLIEDGATITVGGFVAQGCPEHLLQALARRFKETGSPKGLTLVFGGGPGDSAVRGLNHLALPGLLRRTIGAHYGQTPRLAELVRENAVEAYNLPLGAISRLFRCTAAGQPCHITSVGLGTFVDPVHGGGKLNDMTTEDLVTYVEVCCRCWGGRPGGWGAKGASGTPDEGFVVLSLRACLSLRATHRTPYGGPVLY